MRKNRSLIIGKQYRISVGQRRRIQVLTGSLVVLLLLFGFFLLTQKKQREMEKQDLTIRQLSCFLAFYEYDEKQWYGYLKEQGLDDVVYWNDLESFLMTLGVKDHIPYQRPQKNTAVSYGEFLDLYEPLLSLLDGEGIVKQTLITIDSVREEQNEWESGVLESGGETYQVLTSIGEYEQDASYMVYTMDHTILGIAEVLSSTNTEKNRSEEISVKDEDTVTVLLKNGTGVYRDKIYLLLEGDYIRTGWEKSRKTLESGHLLKFINCEAPKDPEEEDYLLVSPQEETGRIYFADKNGNKISEGYRGSFRIYRYKKGYVVVNELSIREYLYGVVPSEMPSSFQEEALKAQAVCARSYTYKHLLQRGSAGYYADLDDSVKYQVYNKSGDAKSTRKAVEDTADQVLMYQNELAVTYYFSTSGGVTQGWDLWGLDQEGSGYLRTVVVHEKEDGFWNCQSMDLSDEESFREFMKQDTTGFYEQDCRYFRWKATLNCKEYTAALNNAVMQRKEAAPDSVIMENEDGKMVSDVKDLGKAQKISVNKRSYGGGITSLLIRYEKGSVELTTEYTIRYCLGACAPEVKLSDGATIQPDLLPSAFFYISSQKNNRIVLCGGGYGHGLGMSQNGANKLAEDGWTYKEILHFFYHGVELVQMVD